MGPIGVSELAGAVHQGGVDGAVAAADSSAFGGAPTALWQWLWTRVMGGAHGVLVREDERGEEKGWRHRAVPFNSAVEGRGV
jgi:hypothetical protein